MIFLLEIKLVKIKQTTYYQVSFCLFLPFQTSWPLIAHAAASLTTGRRFWQAPITSPARDLWALYAFACRSRLLPATFLWTERQTWRCHICAVGEFPLYIFFSFSFFQQNQKPAPAAFLSQPSEFIFLLWFLSFCLLTANEAPNNHRVDCLAASALHLNLI